jgi:hypothetical protein
VLIGGGYAANREAIEAGGRWLAERQEPDGGWAPGARLRIPAWRHLAPEAQEMICLDRRGAFTSAAAVGALGAVLAARDGA